MTFEIDLKALAKEGQIQREIEQHLVSNWIDHLTLQAASGLMLQLDYTFSTQGLKLSGKLSGTVAGLCSRCNQEVSLNITVSSQARFLEGEPPRSGQKQQDEEGRWGIELDEQAGELEYYSGHHLDLSPWLRDEWSLGLPVCLHCDDDACREAAARWQPEEKPTDPRWGFLADLKAQMEEG